MDKPHIAEWLLIRITNRKRAAEIVGDLLEHQPSHFTRAIVAVLFTLTWRWLAACTAATFSGLLVIWPHVQFIESRYPKHHFMPAQPWMKWSEYLMFVALPFVALTTLAAIRYGRRNRLFHTSAPLALLIGCGSCLTWTPHSAITLSTVSLLVFATLLLLPKSRRALACLLIAGAAMTATSIFLGWSVDLLLPTAMHRVAEPYFLLGWPVAIAVAAFVLTRMQRWLLPSNPAETSQLKDISALP